MEEKQGGKGRRRERRKRRKKRVWGKGREREGGGERRFYIAFGSLRLLFPKG